MSIINQVLPTITRGRGSSELRGTRDSSPAPSDTSSSDDRPLPIETIQLPDKTWDEVTLKDIGVEFYVGKRDSPDTIYQKFLEAHGETNTNLN